MVSGWRSYSGFSYWPGGFMPTNGSPIPNGPPSPLIASTSRPPGPPSGAARPAGRVTSAKEGFVMLVICAVLLLVALLSYANGANDNGKGVATLVGFGTATPRQALLWATLTTAVGSGFSFWVAGGMVEAFK